MKNILTIIKKELRAYFNSPTAYIVIVVFLLLWEFLFFRSVFLVGEASLRILFDLLPWIFLVMIPALTMGSIAQEKNDGTLELLLTRPLKESELLIGKFLGSLIFIAIALLFVVPIAWSLGSFGDLDLGVLVGQYLASVLLGAILICLGILASSLFSSQISALLTSVIVSFFFVISGFEIVTSRLPLNLVPFFEQLSVLTHFRSMSRGVIDLRDVWYFISVSVAFLGISHLILIKRKFGNQKRSYRNLQLRTAVFIGIVILTNIIGSGIPGRIDLTEEKLFTLSDTTKKIVTDLDDIVDVTLFASEKLPVQLQPTLREIDDILRDYQTFGKGNIIVTKKNPSDDTEIAEEAISMGIQEIRFNVVSQEEFQVKTGYLGVAISYGGEHESIPFIQGTSDFEYQLTSFIKKLTVEDKKKIVFVSGHGERSSTTDMRLLARELEKQFEVDEITSSYTPPQEIDKENPNQTQSESEKSEDVPLSIPDDTDVLVLAGPKSPLGKESIEKIRGFVSDGGNVLFLVDGVDVTTQLLSASPIQDNDLQKFIVEDYGIEVNPDLVYDLQSNESVSFGGGFMPIILPYPFWVRTINSQEISPITSRIENVTLPWASTITQNDRENIEIIGLLTTTQTGGAQTEQFDISPEQKFTRIGLKEHLLAVSASINNNGTKSRIIVVGDSDFITDQYIQNSAENLAFASEALSWLAQEESLAEIQLKNKTERSLIFQKEDQPTTIKYGNMAFALIVPTLFGSYRLMRRRKMKRRKYDR